MYPIPTGRHHPCFASLPNSPGENINDGYFGWSGQRSQAEGSSQWTVEAMN
jgi:hypothetical protein